jgi:TP901 family phage tail tape measure protein
MADVNANIDINIDSSNALAQLKSLQRQISQFHTSIAKSSEAAALAQRGLQKNLLSSINSIGAFTAEMRTVKTSAESFTDSLEKNKFSMREYFRYAGASTKTFGRLFKSEFDTIGKVAEERVKTLQTQYIKMGRNASGAMEAMAIRPASLDMEDYGTRTAIAAQKQALFNQLMRQGSTNLLNFGKNTQWAGRQLMVGFTLPLMAVGTAATKTFMDMEAQAIKFKKVYGDLFTPKEETQAALDNITELGRQFTKYGVAVATTVGLAAEAAAAGFQGLDLQRQTTEATRLSILGQIDTQKALETTISLQNAFGMSSDKLADSINFLNAVENQTVVSLDDITTAIPKVAPVIQQLGGDVKDLTFFLAAMKEGGINASEGANALKSGLAALINPTGRASEMLQAFGINAKEIVTSNKGDLKATVIEFAEALNQLDPLNRAQAIEQMFGKFQFARLSALFANVTKEGNQASRVLSLANSSVEELSSLSEQELGMTADSSMNKFKKSVEDLKLALVPVGKAFLEAVTPIVEFVGNILEKFANLSDGTKRIITLLTVGIGAAGPVLLMTFGLLANGIANIIKLFLTLRGGYQRLTGQTQILGEQTQYMTIEQLEAAAAAHSLDQTHARLTQTFTAEASAINQLINAYNSAALAASKFAAANPGMMMPTRGARKLANGIVSVPGSGKGDTVPAMLTPGEAVIPTDLAKKYAPLIQGMVADNIPGYRSGRIGSGASGRVGKSGTTVVRPYLENVSNTSGLVNFEDINPSDLADVASIYVKEIMDKAKVSATAIAREMDLWKANNLAAIQAAEAAVNAGKPAADAFGPLADKFKIDMETSGGAVHKFNMTATEIMPELQKDLIEAQTKAKELSLNIKKGADATALAEALPDNIVAKAAATPGPYGSRSKPRQAAVLGQSGSAGIETYGIPRFMLPTNVDPQSMSSKLSTSQEHFSTTRIQEANLATQSKLREKAKRDAEEYKKGTEQAGLKDLYVVSQDRQSPHRLAAQDGKDDANAYSNAAATAVRKGPRRATRPQGPAAKLSEIQAGMPASPQVLAAGQQQLNNIKQSSERLSRMNNAIMGGTFALTSLAGAGTMAGGTIGNLSSQVMKYSGLLFGLMSVTQLLTQTKVLELARTRANAAGLLVANAATGKMGLQTGLFSGGIKKLLPNLLNFGKIIARFLGPVGLVISGLLLTKNAFDLYRKSKEKERMATEGLADAMTMTTDKVKLLAGLLGQTPTARAGAGARVSANQLNATEQTAVDELRSSKEFLDKYKNDILAIKNATVSEAQIAFNAIALDLGGQGFSKDAVKTYIDALGEEAGKTEVSLKFKQLDLSTEEGKAAAIKLAKDTTTGFNKAFEDGIKKTRKVVGGGRGGVILGPETIALTKEQQKQLNITSAALGNTLTGLTSAFGNQTIKADEYNKKMAEISATIPKGTEGLLLMDKVLLNVSPAFAEASKGIKDYDTKMLLLRASLVNASVAETIFQDLISKNPAKVAAAKAQLEKYRVVADALAKNVVIPDPFKEVDTGGTKEKSPFQKAKEDLIAQRKELENTRKTYSKLKSVGMETGKAFEAAKNPILAAALATTKVGSSQWKTLLGLIKQVNAESKKASLSPEEMFDVVEQSIEAKYRNAIKTGEAAIETAQQAVSGIEKEISTIQDSIEKKQRNIELTFNRPIETLQAESSVLSEQLRDIDRAAEAVNAKYDLQEKALSKISQINQDIVAQEKSKLTLADALSQGDISAAAKAAQEMRATEAEASVRRSTEALQVARDSEIGGLRSATGLTKDQIAQRQFEIEKQIYAIEQQKSIATTQIRIEEDKIYSIQQGRLLTAQNTVIKAEEELQKIRTKLTDELAVNNQAKQFWADKELADNLAKVRAIEYQNEIKKTQNNAQGVLDRILALNRTVTTTHIIRTITTGGGVGGSGSSGTGSVGAFDKKMYGGKIMPMSMGGLVPKYMAMGGRVGSDTVPAMLTPGEFVMNKKSTQEFGPLLSMLNESKYPSMIGSGSSAQIPINNISSSVNDNSTAVYNYTLDFNINGNNSNPSDIARSVMTEIKRVDAQRIRGQR